MIVVLVAAFVLAFGSVAQATFRGWSPIRTQAEVDAGILQGYITFPEARVEMTRNGVSTALQNTAHGGYITTTTKCAVCHSAHRASGVNSNTERNIVTAWSGQTPVFTTITTSAGEGTGAQSTGDSVSLANARNQFFLTAGGTTCSECHVSSGGQASRLLVEWGGPAGYYTGGGPHGSAARGCTMCHNAGIHGLTSSRFNVMNVFMLGATRGAVRGTFNVDTSTPTTSGASTNTFENGRSRDAQIVAEINAGKVLRGGVLDIPASFTFNGAPVFNRAPVAAASNGSTWWADGTRALGPVGSAAPGTNDITYAAARSLATAYTCGEIGCHRTSAMFNLNWGMGFTKDNQVRTGLSMSPNGTVEVTGHVLPSLRNGRGGNNQACGPCHAGNPAGFPTASTNAGRRDDTRRAYGCDQCHDMVGVATNSTAWPHGNRNIRVYEWDSAGVQHETTPAAGNLWMYGGSIARSINASGNGATPIVGSFQGRTSVNAGFADQSWTVLTGIGSGRYGLDTNRPYDQSAGYAWAGIGTTLNRNSGLTDGSCLKCHVAIDSASMSARGSVAADALYHQWPGRTNTGGTVIAPIWNGGLVTGSSRLFLYR